MVRIRILRTIAEVELGKQIYRAHEFVHELMQIGSIKSYEDFQRVRKNHADWSEEVLSRLRRYFEGGDELVAQWEALQVGRVDEDKSWLENIKGLSHSAQRGTEWLKNLHDRLKDFPQSPTTPMAVLAGRPKQE